MSAIYTEITIEWAGEEYQTKGSFEVCHKIEQKVNLATFNRRIAEDGAPCLTSLAIIYASLLRNVGVAVKDGDVYDAMYNANDDSGMTQNEIILASALVVSALTPRKPPAKKKKRASSVKK